jgi:hypothetical protein
VGGFWYLSVMKDIIRKILKEQVRTIQRLNTDEFITKAKNIHGDKYDYSQVEYTNIKSPVKIICPKEGHGEFLQRAEHHLNGAGCPICAGRGKEGRRTNDEIIALAKKVHGDKYDYSEIDYKNAKTPLKIICPIPKHGVFYQTSDNHIRAGYGCPACSKQKKPTTTEFIELSKEVHGNKYDYSLVDYKNAKTDVQIICPKENHGIFQQRPDHHINGAGCPICRESRGEKYVAAVLKNLNIHFERQKYFKDCKGIKGKKYCRKLPFDFYLPEFNAVIEFDGAQHYNPILFYGGANAFSLTQQRDQIKNQYCKDKGINMIRIPYTVDNENIPQFIKEKLGIQ